MKVFGEIDQYNSESPFKGWMREIMIHTSIDQYRKELKHQHKESLTFVHATDTQPLAVSNLSHEELIGLVQKLSPAYRAVFNLYVIDGFTHPEISKLLKISTGTSKSNLLKARENLRKMLGEMNMISYEKTN
ncbi:MAG: RNA polymerase sigma factor [Cytophagales bacterium]|nr:RNA polymerase sigma factor [Cytophagales bacterium]